MGLESIELLVSVEEVFNIEITEEEACKIHTVNDMVICISKKIDMAQGESEVKKSINTLFKKSTSKLNINNLDLSKLLKDQMNLEELKKMWTFIQQETSLRLPILKQREKVPLNSESIWNLTLNETIDWIIALNYMVLINPKQILSLYEIQSIIKGILIQHFNIPFNRITPQSRFIYDLGLD